MSKELQTQREPSLVEVIQQIVQMPAGEGLDRVAMLERLVALKERSDEQARKQAFASALASLQAELPQIDKKGRIEVGGQLRSKYARVEDIDVQIRPFLAKWGFSFSWETQPAPLPDEVRYIGRMTHSAGHWEEKTIDFPIENEVSSHGKLLMTKVQKRGSTLSFAIRTLLRMHLNLIMRDEDNGGQGNIDLISAKDLAVVKEMIQSTNTDTGKFLEYLKVSSFEDIQHRDVAKAMALLRAKAGKKAE